jgi:tripeptidyl-peptidase-1
MPGMWFSFPLTPLNSYLHLNRYGQHLTTEEAEALVAAHPDSTAAVESWLEYHGIRPEDVSRHSGGGDWVTITVSVAQAERMLGTKYNVYNHRSTSEKVVRALSYSLPRELHSHVSVVAPTTYFGTMRSMRATHFLEPDSKPVPVESITPEVPQNGRVNAVPPTSCNTKITPSCLRTLYNTANYVVAGGNNNTLGVAGYLNEYANHADLQVSFHTTTRVLGPASPVQSD